MAKKTPKKQLSSDDLAKLSQIGSKREVSPLVYTKPQDPLKAANIKSLAQLEMERAALEAKMAAKKFVAKRLAKSVGLSPKLASMVGKKLLKQADKKPLDRLSGEYSYRVFLLIVVAFFFDSLQLLPAIVGLIPILGFFVAILINFFIWLFAFLVMWFMWRHFEVSFWEKFVSKKGILPLILHYLRFIFIIFEIFLPFFPGITLQTLITVTTVRQLDSYRKDKYKLEELNRQIAQRRLYQNL